MPEVRKEPTGCGDKQRCPIDIHLPLLSFTTVHSASARISYVPCFIDTVSISDVPSASSKTPQGFSSHVSPIQGSSLQSVCFLCNVRLSCRFHQLECQMDTVHCPLHSPPWVFFFVFTLSVFRHMVSLAPPLHLLIQHQLPSNPLYCTVSLELDVNSNFSPSWQWIGCEALRRAEIVSLLGRRVPRADDDT